MKESTRQLFMSALRNKDFGWKFGIKRNLQFNYHNCKYESESVMLEPNDTLEIHPCEGKTISWEGTLRWDGRRLTEVPCQH